jgi:hypothetical protein
MHHKVLPQLGHFAAAAAGGGGTHAAAAAAADADAGT